MNHAAAAVVAAAADVDVAGPGSCDAESWRVSLLWVPLLGVLSLFLCESEFGRVSELVLKIAPPFFAALCPSVFLCASVASSIV